MNHVLRATALSALVVVLLMGASTTGCGLVDGIQGTLDGDPPCNYEGDPTFCERVDDECGEVTAVDNCGQFRSVDCSRYQSLQCAEFANCVAADDDPDLDANRCVCPQVDTEQPDAEICEVADIDCGSIDAGSLCGDWEQFGDIDCGGCPGPQECGVADEPDNMCSCPCQVDGQCYATGESPPGNDCLVCNPEVYRDELTSATDGAECSSEIDGAVGSCDGGSCQSLECSDAEQTLCESDALCVDLGSSVEYCGSCDHSCDSGEFCHAGACHPGSWSLFANVLDGDTVKFDGLSQEQWVYADYVPQTPQAIPMASAVTPQGVLYVGTNFGEIERLEPDGSSSWRHSDYDADIHSVAVDDNSVYIGTGEDFSTNRANSVVKLDPGSNDGEEVWVFSDHDDVVSGVAVGPDGQVVTASGDGTIFELDPDGSVAWEYQAPENFSGYHDVAIDADGMIYAAAIDGYVQKFDSTQSDSDPLWTFDEQDFGVQAVSVDADGYIYTASNDETVRKIDSDGDEVWSFLLHTGVVRDVAVDPDGFVYSSGDDNRLYKIGPDGDLVTTVIDATDQIWDISVEPGEIGAFSAAWTP